MKGWMDEGWMGWMDERNNRQSDRQMEDGWMDGWMDGRKDAWLGGWLNGWMDEHEHQLTSRGRTKDWWRSSEQVCNSGSPHVSHQIRGTSSRWGRQSNSSC